MTEPKAVEMVTMTKAVYDRLKEAEEFLNALRAAGVDNWDGYDYALEILHGEDAY